jgi:hypothetical protein
MLFIMAAVQQAADPPPALVGPSRHALRWDTGLPCAGLPFGTEVPRASIGKGMNPTKCNPRHRPANADGPLAGNGDVGAMLGGSWGSNITLFLTKNDLWNVATSQPECRYGTFNYTLFVPPMNITTNCGTARSLDRSSQGQTGGVTILPVGRQIPDANWAAVQHMANGSVTGSYRLDEFPATSRLSLQTQSFVVAPYDDLTSKVSFVLTLLSLSSTAADQTVDFTVGTHAGHITGPVVGAAAGGRNESWGALVTIASPVPSVGMRKGKNVSVSMATRVVLGSHGSGSKLIGSSGFLLSAGQSVWVATAVLSNIDNAEQEPTAAAVAALLALTPQTLDTMRAAHVAWWCDYWSLSSITLPEGRTDIERLWYSSQYVLGAATRFGGSAKKTAPAYGSAWLFGGEHNAFTLDYVRCVQQPATTFYLCYSHAMLCSVA